MNSNTKLGEKLAILATLDPASVAPGTVVTTFVPALNFHSFLAVIKTGVLGAGATVDAKLRQATDAAGTGAKDVVGKAITQIVKATGDTKQALLECRSDDLDGNNGYGFVALSITVGVAASILDAALIGGNPRFSPTAPYNQAGVVQIV